MTKFDRYLKAYFDLSDELKNLDNETIRELVKGWEQSLKQIEDFVTSKKVTKSQMVSGLEQGLREIPEIICDLPSPIKEQALLMCPSQICEMIIVVVLMVHLELPLLAVKYLIPMIWEMEQLLAMSSQD